MTQYLNAMRKYATFSGRASRSEFWLYSLFLFILLIVAATMDGVLGFADEGAIVIAGVVNLLHLIPTIAVSVRRLHDTDKSGWWLLLAFTGIGAIVLMIFFCLSSTRGSNSFGAAPDGQAHANNLVQPQTTPAASQAVQSDPLDQLNTLKALRDSGAIDEAEFTTMKADLLKKVE